MNDHPITANTAVIFTKTIEHVWQLFLMKRGGLELYAGAVGKESCELIKYFEVR